MYALIRPILFLFDPEQAHYLGLKTLNYIPRFIFPKITPTKTISVMGLIFPHAVGLAAGLDKNGDYLEGLSKLGFAFIELGTVTPRPQIGNPKPRLFRIPQAQAIINRMGFNNKGVDALVNNVKNANYDGILGINIGKNKDTPLDQANEDYLYCLKKVYECASYITINISSPNTPDLRLLQQSNYLKSLLNQMVDERNRLADQFSRHVPLVVKFSPDESDESLKQMADIVLHSGVEGIIATNTTNSRAGVEHLANSNEQGGLSGLPLCDRATACLRVVKEVVGDSVTLIGVGGIHDRESAQQKLQAGASLLQVYSGLIYKGPGLIKSLL